MLDGRAHPWTVLHETIAVFQAGCQAWERDVGSLFDDLDQFLVAHHAEPDCRRLPAPSPSESGWRQIHDHQAQLAQELTGVRGLIEQQTEVLAALVDALAASGPPTTSRETELAAARRDDPVANSVLAQYGILKA